MKISAKQYALTLYELTEGENEERIKGNITRFIAYLKRAGDMKKIHEIIVQFNTIYNKYHNILEATVISARTLTADEMIRVESFIVTHYGGQHVVVHHEVKKDIKGGIVIKIDDEVLDGSVQERLYMLNRHLLQT